MKIDTLADLRALIKVCRKEGINAIEVDGVKLELGDVPVRQKLKTEESKIVNEMPSYTEEELMTWSSNG